MKKDDITRVGVMGGTFDPVHYGHLIAAERAREKFNLQKVYFIPSGNPPHKKCKDMAPVKDRYNMVKAAIDLNPAFEILDMEIKREGCSYTIDTINELTGIFGSRYKFYFIIGADIVESILGWKNVQELAQKTEFVVVARPGKWEEKLKEDICMLTNKGFKIGLVETPLIYIASTDIRDRVRAGKSVNYLMPQNVRDYIYKNKLYS